MNVPDLRFIECLKSVEITEVSLNIFDKGANPLVIDISASFLQQRFS